MILDWNRLNKIALNSRRLASFRASYLGIEFGLQRC